MGSLSRFEQLALPHMEAAFNLAFWLVRSRSDAEDVVQEAYLRAFRAFDNFRGEDVRPWLFAIVRNAAYRALGDRQRSANVVSLDEVFTRAAEEDGPGRRPEPPTDEPSAEDRLIQSAERELVLSALAELPAAFREVVILRELEGFDYRAIAEITGSVVGTVMSRLARGRVALRKALMRRIEEDKSNVV